MKLFFITNNPTLAEFVVLNGVDRIFVDLEIMGKVARQGHLSTVISKHSIGDVQRVRLAVPSAEMLVRVNPMHEKLSDEVNKVIEFGADIIMLPMFHSAQDVAQFVELVAGRAKVSLLVETVGAMNCLADIVKIKGVDEIHIGLNDLHLELKNSFMFQPLVDGLVDGMAEILRDARIPFGIGGIARVGEGALPAELLISEHVRLGSSAAILSRTFHRQAKSVEEIVEEMDFSGEILKIRNATKFARQMTAKELSINQQDVKERVAKLVAQIEAKAVV